MRRIVSLLLVVMAGAMLAACEGGVSTPKERKITIYIDGTRGCKEEPKPVVLWNKAGGGAAPEGKGISEIPHGTRLEVEQTEEYFGISYYQVVYEGQRGWVPENYVSETEPICPQAGEDHDPLQPFLSVGLTHRAPKLKMSSSSLQECQRDIRAKRSAWRAAWRPSFQSQGSISHGC